MSALPLPEKRLLTGDEAAAYCGVSVNTFRARVRIAPVKIGHSVRYDRRDLDHWITRQNRSEPMTGDDWLGMLDEGESVRS